MFSIASHKANDDNKRSTYSSLNPGIGKNIFNIASHKRSFSDPKFNFSNYKLIILFKSVRVRKINL